MKDFSFSPLRVSFSKSNTASALKLFISQNSCCCPLNSFHWVHISSQGQCLKVSVIFQPVSPMQLILILQIMLLFRLLPKWQISLWYITDSHSNPISFAFQYYTEGLDGILSPGQMHPTSISQLVSHPQEKRLGSFITFAQGVRGMPCLFTPLRNSPQFSCCTAGPLLFATSAWLHPQKKMHTETLCVIKHFWRANSSLFSWSSVLLPAMAYGRKDTLSLHVGDTEGKICGESRRKPIHLLLQGREQHDTDQTVKPGIQSDQGLIQKEEMKQTTWH